MTICGWREAPQTREDIWACLDGCGVSADRADLDSAAQRHTGHTGHRTIVTRHSVREFHPVILADLLPGGKE